MLAPRSASLYFASTVPCYSFLSFPPVDKKETIIVAGTRCASLPLNPLADNIQQTGLATLNHLIPSRRRRYKGSRHLLGPSKLCVHLYRHHSSPSAQKQPYAEEKLTMAIIYESDFPAPTPLPVGNLFDLVAKRAIERPNDQAFIRADGKVLT